jgi:hypothetical protein
MDKLQPIPQDKIQEGHPWRDWLFHLREKVNASALVGSGVTSIVAGTNVTIAPVTGLGDVTVNATLSVGPTGPTGPTGPSGSAGISGTIGIDGIDGNDGDRGSQGPTGNTGNTGAKGDIGMVGLDGEEGPEGMPIQGNPGVPGSSIWLWNVPQVIHGFDGEDAQEAVAIPGAVGPQGATGIQGVPGVAVFALDGEEGPEGFHIPGNQGIAGSTGAQGVPGVSIFVLDGEEGPEGMPIPGQIGPIGLTGATGPQGLTAISIAFDGDEGPEGMSVQGIQGNIGTQAPPLGFGGGFVASTTINDTTTPTTGGATLTSQVAAVNSVWRVCAHGSFVAVSSATARNAVVQPFWGTTALPSIAVVVLISVIQTTNWSCEFILTGSSTTGIWTTGWLNDKFDYPAIVAGTSSADKLDLLTAATTAVTAGAQTLDLRFSMSVAVATDQWVVNNVTIERLR